MNTTHQVRAHEVTAPGSGAHHHFLNHLATIKVAAQGDRSMSVVQFEAGRGFGAPLHRHEHEDELFVVIDGELAFTLDGDTLPGPTGTIAYLPREIPHTFQVISDGATILNVTASRSHVPRFDEMVSALGTSLTEPVLPPDVAIDPGEVAQVCADHGITILGPPPPPL
ncbi:cupin domain-containing protein [Euzebya tangerina]|uniref:cupin domain-containing protein n=1 Tax=Euzebya tangerina TaxID=591198 RepID=UPI000E30FE53|nr:cupin domain-containing protein [Euzebya tangerina]